MHDIEKNISTDGFNIYFDKPITQLNINQVRTILKEATREKRRTSLDTYSDDSYNTDNPESRRNWENLAFEFAENLHPDNSWFVIAPDKNGDFYIYYGDIEIEKGADCHTYLTKNILLQPTSFLDIEKPKFNYDWRTYKIYRD